MIDARILGRHISEIAGLVGAPVVVPNRPHEGDPEYGLTRYLTFPARGFNILIDWNDVAECVQFFGDQNDEGYAAYAGTLPRGLSFQNSRADVRLVLGEPKEQRNGGGSVLGIKIRPWDWFVYEGAKLHFEYQDACDGIRMISMMPLPPAA